MKQHVTHYHILGVETNVGAAEIKRAYRRLVKSYHPDVDHHEQTDEAKALATEQMMRLNEAYETLKDNLKRQAYDLQIGLYQAKRLAKRGQDSLDEEQQREHYLRKVFLPSRHAITVLLTAYPSQLRKLSLDIYDEQLLGDFEHYVDELQLALQEGSQSLNQGPWPVTLNAAVQMMRYSIAQAADGLEEMHFFCTNFDYSHLSMAGNLFRIALDLSKQALRLTRN